MFELWQYLTTSLYSATWYVNISEVVLPCLHLMRLLQELHCIQRKQLEVANAVNSCSGKMVTLFMVSVLLLRRPTWPLSTFIPTCISCFANVLGASTRRSWRDRSTFFATDHTANTKDLTSASVFQLRDGLSVAVDCWIFCGLQLIIRDFDTNFDSSD